LSYLYSQDLDKEFNDVLEEIKEEILILNGFLVLELTNSIG
jgi:hypothetical protein